MSRRNRRNIDKFIKRELTQGAHLRRALRRHYQKTFYDPGGELARLRRAQVRSLLPHNPYCRTRWLRAMARRLGTAIGARPPDFVLRQPIFLVTVIDSRQVIDPGLEMNDRRVNPTWKAIRSAYRTHLRGFDYIGMLDAALFVSAQRAFSKVRFAHVHLHALVWNTTAAALDAADLRARRTIRPLFTYTHAFDHRPVEVSDFLQVLWYMNKTPRKQYQAHLRTTGRWRQYKRDINGVNAVRLYDIMSDTTLDELAFAGGEGVGVLENVLRDVQCRRR